MALICLELVIAIVMEEALLQLFWETHQNNIFYHGKIINCWRESHNCKKHEVTLW